VSSLRLSGLFDIPRTNEGGGSYEICPSCGFQFGVSDENDGISYDEWRKNWIKLGMPWSSIGIKPPPNWDPKDQIRNSQSP
jgi:hypothetical protein